jgi:hypothetical protein
MTLASEFATQYPDAADSMLSTMGIIVTYIRYALLFLQNSASKITLVSCARVQQDMDGQCAEVI